MVVSRMTSEQHRVSAEDRERYMRAWAEKMVEIWRERIIRLGVYDTGLLHEKFTETVRGDIGTDMHVIMHKFMMYGIYQDVGVGRGYTPDNGGQLHFLALPCCPDKERDIEQKGGWEAGCCCWWVTRRRGHRRRKRILFILHEKLP